MESRKIIAPTGSRCLKPQHNRIKSINAEASFLPPSITEKHPSVTNNDMDWRKTSVSETDVPTVTPTREMVGAYPKTPTKRAFKEFAQDESVQTGRNVWSVATAYDAVLVIGTAMAMTATTISEISGRAAPVANNFIQLCIALAQSGKRRFIEIYSRAVKRVSSLHISSRLPSFRKAAPPVLSLPPLAFTPLSPQATTLAMGVCSESRIENQNRCVPNNGFRSLRLARHQDYSPITRPTAPTLTTSLSPNFMAHRLHGLHDHAISKPARRLPEWTRRRHTQGWMPTCRKGKPRRPPPPFLSPNAKQALARKNFKTTLNWDAIEAGTSTAADDWTRIPRRNLSDRFLAEATPPYLSVGQHLSTRRPVSRKLFTDTEADVDARTTLPNIFGTPAANPPLTFHSTVDFSSDDESDASYAPSGASDDYSEVSDYDELSFDEDLAAVDQGLFSPGSPGSELRDLDDSTHPIVSLLDRVDPQDELGSVESELDDSEDELESVQDGLANSQDGLNNVYDNHDTPQDSHSTQRIGLTDHFHQDEHIFQQGKAEPVVDEVPFSHAAGINDDDNSSSTSLDSLEAQWQREALYESPKDQSVSLEAQWQRELELIRPLHDIPTPVLKSGPIVPIPTTPLRRATTPVISTPHDAHLSAQSVRRYDFRSRTSKSHRTKEDDRIKAEKKREEQTKRREEKRLAKERAKEEEATARRILEEAEKAEWILRGSRDKVLNNLVRPVDREWETTVYNRMARPQAAEVAMSVAGQSLTRYAFGTLLPGPNDSQSAWLNDEIVTAYLDLVCAYGNSKHGITQEAIKKRTSKPKYAAFSTQFMTTLRGPRGYSSVARWAGRKQIAGKDMLGCEYVFVPVHVNSNHWTMLIISPTRRTVEYFDSFHSSGTVYTTAIMDYLRGELKEHFKEEEWRIWSSAGSAAQLNAQDCGVFSVTTAKAVTLGFTPKIAFAQKDMKTQRMRMAAELIHGAFIETGKEN